MPITQEQMIKQMQEARANHQEMKALRELILNYIGHLRTQYPQNNELGEAMSALEITVRMRPIPDDRETYMNEQYYTRFASRNADAKERQRLVRAGVIQPRERNFHKRKTRRNIPDEYAFRDEPAQPYGRGKAPIMPRDDPDDAELEFETPEELAPIANLPAGALADPLAGENNSQDGVDIPADLPDDSNGNPAKEQG
jgi:hypothetical protein